MKTVCIYHSIDLDGWMSAAIVKHWWITTINQDKFEINIRNNGLAAIDNNSELDADTIDFIGYNYGQPIPDLSKYDKLIMCDISFPLEDMIKIAPKLIWIDHHISAISTMKQDETFVITVKDWATKVDYSACELTWQYFFPNDIMPEIVRLLGRYDCFGHKGTDEEQKVLEFQYGARQVIGNYLDAYDYLTHTDKDIWYDIYEKGEVIYGYLCVDAQQSYNNGFKIEFDNPKWDTAEHHPELQLKLKFICINKERFNPINFGIDYHKDGYDGAACFHYANGKWNFSLYSQTVDCSIIAKQYGGGGHKSAAGFIIDDINLIIKK